MVKLHAQIVKIFMKITPSNFHSTLGYQCNICDINFAKPIIFFSCNSCNMDKFSIDDARWIELYKYKLKSNNINKIKSNLFLLHDLEQFFNNSGYSVKQYEKFVNEEQIVRSF